jgi:hypothetical protein
VASDSRPPFQMSPASDRPGRQDHDRARYFVSVVGAYTLVVVLDIAEGPLMQAKGPISPKIHFPCLSWMQMASKVTRLMFRYPSRVEHITDTPTFLVLPAEASPRAPTCVRYYMAFMTVWLREPNRIWNFHVNSSRHH